MSDVVWIPKSLKEEKIEITKKEGYEFYDEYGNLIHTTKIVLKKSEQVKLAEKVSCECHKYFNDNANFVESIKDVNYEAEN